VTILKTPVDVVTVTRNDVIGLAATQISVLEQTHRDLCWIVIDGNSVDGTPASLAALQETRLRYVSEPDDGIYDAMNKGASMGAGKVLVFMNSGDRFASPHSLENLLSLHDDLDLSWGYGIARIVDEQKRPIALHAFHPYARSALVMGVHSVPHQAAYITRALFERLGGYRPDGGIAADQEMFVRAAMVVMPRLLWEVVAERSAGGVTWGRKPSQFALDMRRFRINNDIRWRHSRTLDNALTLAVAAWKTLARHAAAFSRQDQ
jgi:glycosyltransferase involved in cell wall biosynthesis